MTGEQACLPRSGGAAVARAFGLLRKWPPRPKPFVSHQDAKMLKKFGRGGRFETKAKEFAKLTGQSCSRTGTTRKKRKD